MVSLIRKMLVVLLLVLTPQMATAQSSPCVFDSWGAFLGAEPQTFERREVIETQAGPIFAIEFGEIAGEYAKVYVFLVDNGECFTKAVSLGSYAGTNSYAAEAGQLAPGERLYHLDLYLPGEHVTLGMYNKPLTYERTRELALEALR